MRHLRNLLGKTQVMAVWIPAFRRMSPPSPNCPHCSLISLPHFFTFWPRFILVAWHLPSNRQISSSFWNVLWLSKNLCWQATITVKKSCCSAGLVCFSCCPSSPVQFVVRMSKYLSVVHTGAGSKPLDSRWRGYWSLH